MQELTFAVIGDLHVGSVCEEVEAAIRIMRIRDNTVRSGLLWHERERWRPGPLGTLAGDVAFEWTLPERPYVYPDVRVK